MDLSVSRDSLEELFHFKLIMLSIYIGLATAGLLFTYFPESNAPVVRPDWIKTAKKIDYIGAALSIVGITLL